MFALSRSSLFALASSLTLPLMPPTCSGSVEVNPSGNTIKLTWSKDVVTKVVTTTLPPQFPGGQMEVDGKVVKLPANPTQTPMQMTIETRDPLILQVPLAWTLVGGSVTTAAGTGPVVVTLPPLPAGITIAADGSASFSTFYAAEPGTKLYMGDYPAGLGVDGPQSGTALLRYPPAAPSAFLKTISAGKATLLTPRGPITWYPSLDGLVTDFAAVHGLPNEFFVDTDAVPCASPGGGPSTMTLPLGDWHVGTRTTVNAAGLLPGLPAVFALGAGELAPPVAIGTPGCKLRIAPLAGVFLSTVASAGGTGMVPVAVPNQPGLVGLALTWQAVQVDPGNGQVRSTNLLVTQVER